MTEETGYSTDSYSQTAQISTLTAVQKGQTLTSVTFLQARTQAICTTHNGVVTNVRVLKDLGFLNVTYWPFVHSESRFMVSLHRCDSKVMSLCSPLSLIWFIIVSVQLRDWCSSQGLVVSQQLDQRANCRSVQAFAAVRTLHTLLSNSIFLYLFLYSNISQ